MYLVPQPCKWLSGIITPCTWMRWDFLMEWGGMNLENWDRFQLQPRYLPGLVMSKLPELQPVRNIL
jgi:hypothetical protein